jgi:hypothetical protein
MIKRLLAIAFIFLCTCFAWAVLGATILRRTDLADARLRGRVQSVWGQPQTQQAPLMQFEDHSAPPSASDINVALSLEYRQKGLLWYSTYKVGFQGDYEFRNPEAIARTVGFILPFPGTQAIYDDLQFMVNGQPVEPVIGSNQARVNVDLAPGQTARLQVGYRSQGIDSWKYSFGSDVKQVQNFHMRMTTNFKDIDFPDNTLAPGAKRETKDGWQLDWNYKNLLSGYQIAMEMPAKLQPGPLASEISFFAPVPLFFFFFVLFMLTSMREIDLHPMNYFFLACAFFAFHLLLAYLVDHLDLYLSFAISSAVSVLLVASYLRIVAGTKFALRDAAVAQFIYLVLFSSAFFFRGFTGLAITIGAILTLFLVMQMTGKVRWSEKFAAPAPPPLPASRV